MNDGKGSQASFLAAVSQAREYVRAGAGTAPDGARRLADAVATVVEASATVLVPGQGGLVRIASAPGTFAAVGEVVPVDVSVCGEAFTSGQPVRVDDASGLALVGGVDPAACCPGAKALLAVPITDGGRVVGVVCAAASAPGWFDAMDERALALIAQVAAARIAEHPSRPPSPRAPVHPGGVPGHEAPATRAAPRRALPAPAQDAVFRQGVDALAHGPGAPGLGVFTWRTGDRQLTWSRELFRIVGLDPAGFRPDSASCRRHVHPDDLAAADRMVGAVHAAVTQGRELGVTETLRVVGADAAVRHLQVWAVATPHPGGPEVHGAAVDVTRQVRDRQLLERLSATDPVTGLGNRLAFDRRMQELLAAPGSPEVSLLLLDLDRFKLVNDSLGHQVGDRLLVEVARRLRAVRPDGSVTARMGGDEFVVVPPPGDELAAGPAARPGASSTPCGRRTCCRTPARSSSARRASASRRPPGVT